MQDHGKADSLPVTESVEPPVPATETRLSKSGWAGKSQELVISVLALMNRQFTGLDTIPEILSRVKEFTGCEAVGIRLCKDGDFPYFEAQGFPVYFIEAENSLCSRTEDGQIVRDSSGYPVLECMCGNVIRGRTDASLPFFSEGGSFWTNSTTELLASTTEGDRQTRTRNRCNGEGYESVALIPLRSDREVIGLLQLNDSSKNRFTADIITYLEGIGASIGIVLTRVKVEDALRESELWMRSMFESLEESVLIVTPDRTLKEVNPATVKIFGYEKKDIIGRSTEILHVDHEHYVEFGKRIKECFDLGASAEFQFESKRANGEVFPTEHTVSQLRDGNGMSIGIVSVVRDITERKRLEQEKSNLIVELQKALSEVKKLSGFIPICASCKKIRDDKGYWNEVEKYIGEHSEAQFSHGICPDCARKLYPELFEDPGNVPQLK